MPALPAINTTGDGDSFHSPKTSHIQLQPTDGSDIRCFLDTAEVVFKKKNIPPQEWGEYLGCFLKGDARVYWTYIRRSQAIRIENWQDVKNAFEKRFCTSDIAETVKRLENIRWRGNQAAYSAEFGKIVAAGAIPDQKRLVKLFYSNIPTHILKNFTCSGTKEFQTWEEAADALHNSEAAWEKLTEDLKDSSSNRRANIFRERFHSAEPYARNNDMRQQWQAPLDPSKQMPLTQRQDPLVCNNCQGRGHLATNCPNNNEAFRRNGRTCMRCGGLHHFAHHCTTPLLREAPNRSSAVLRPNVNA